MNSTATPLRKATPAPLRPAPAAAGKSPSSLPLDSIRTDGGTQPREAIDQDVVKDYADLYRNGVALPPLLVFFDGSEHWLADGFHRLRARRLAEFELVEVEVRQGTQADARWAACAANKAHGLHRSSADKRRAVAMALAAQPESSDRAIAEHVGVGYGLVADVRRQLPESGSSTRVGLDGRRRPVPLRPPPRRPSPAMAAPPGAPGPAPVIDEAGRPVTDPRVADALANGQQLDDLWNEVHDLKRRILALPDDGIGRELRKQQIELDFKSIAAAVRFAKPYTTCPRAPCKAGCRICHGTQWTNKEKWETSGKTPEERWQ